MNQCPPFAPLRASLGPRRLSVEPPREYPVAAINVTNHCNLKCAHCFAYREGKADPQGQMTAEQVLAEAELLRDRHRIRWVWWLGGEPMIRWRMLERAVPLFAKNTIATNGTIPLRDFGANLTYSISLDGPGPINDAVRGQGVFDRAMANLAALPPGFRPKVQIQCMVHRENQHHLEALVEAIRPTRADGVVFTFYVPRYREVSAMAWDSVEEREEAIDIVDSLKHRYPDFVWNSRRSLQLMRPATAKLVTDHCPGLEFLLPLSIDGDHFTSPLCCFGDEPDCDRCGAWGLFYFATQMAGPWDELVPPINPSDRPSH